VKTSKILTKAKKYLWDGKSSKGETHICFAVGNTSCSDEDYERVTDIIALRIAPCNCASTWLRNAIGSNPYDAGEVAVQRWRHAWVDQMIEEFKAKGD
jgi:hypothetical protein